MRARWNTPVLLDPKVHQRGPFSCGAPELDDWIKKYASQSQAAGTAAAAHRSPDPIPAVVMGRLAVDAKFAGKGLGEALLRDALERTLLIAGNAVVKIFLVHAKDERAKSFYQHYGFEESPVDALTLLLLVHDIPGA